jgi:hypothetical protein
LESPRTFELTGNELSVIVDNILGGREYEIQATVTNETGQKAIARIKTPYIREFENIVSDYLFGAEYMQFWNIYDPNSPAGRWREIGTVYEPLLGRYSSNDKIVINRHIDVATGYGIRVFGLDFGWIRPNTPFDKVAREHLLQSELANSIKFYITYHSDAVVGESWSKGPSALRSDFSFLAEHYFNHPSYLKVNGRFFVVILNIPHYWREFDINRTNALFNELKGMVKDKYGYELFLAADIWPEFAPSILNEPNLPFDAILQWGNMWHNIGTNKATYERYANRYTTHWKKWAPLVEERGMSFIPVILPGFDNKPFVDSVGQEHRYITRDPEGFLRFLRYAKEVTTPPLKMIIIPTYNNFQEGSSLEPTKEYGFTYLDVVKKALY